MHFPGSGEVEQHVVIDEIADRIWKQLRHVVWRRLWMLIAFLFGLGSWVAAQEIGQTNQGKAIEKLTEAVSTNQRVIQAVLLADTARAVRIRSTDARLDRIDLRTLEIERLLIEHMDAARRAHGE